MTQAQMIRMMINNDLRAGRILLTDGFEKEYKHRKEVVDRFFKGIMKCLRMGEKVVIPGFGTFEIKTLGEQKYFDLNSAKPRMRTIGRRKHPRFRPSDVLVKRIRTKGKRR